MATTNQQMKLSEAMRLGAMLAPQAFGYSTDEHGGRCALMSAAESIGVDLVKITDIFSLDRILGTKFPILKALTTCPECFCSPLWDLFSRVLHLNDKHHWSRERIADWVAAIEAQRPLPAEVDGPVHAEVLAVAARSGVQTKKAPSADSREIVIQLLKEEL